MPPHQTRTSRTRRFPVCHRHPNHPVTGFCALCLKDRLSILDPSSGQLLLPAGQPPHLRRSTSPELRRSKSVAVEKRDDVVQFDPRRNSCDVRARNSVTLSDLFGVDDSRKLRFSIEECGVEEGFVDHDREIRVLDDNIELSSEIRVLDDLIELNNETRVLDDDEEVMEGDLKTMKEIIDLELKDNKRNLRSVFGYKLGKWGKKHKEKKESRFINDGNESKLGESCQDYGLGRRSCDTEPRFSIDKQRLSVEEPRYSLDEGRVSWDGYMMARTIPRLTPMLSVVDNMALGSVKNVTNVKTMENLQMCSISEDGVSSGGSGKSNSDSSSSNRGSRSSSSTKTVGFSGGGDDGKAASNARVSPASDVVFQGTKLVITEKELKDWHLNSIKNNNNLNNVESASNVSNSISETSAMNVLNPSNEQKKKVMSSRWRKVCNLWGHKQKPDDKNGKNKNEHIAVSKVESGNASAKLVNSRSRRDEFVLDRNRSKRYSTSDIDSGLLRLYLTPFRNSRRNKFGRSRAPSLMVTNGLQLH